MGSLFSGRKEVSDPFSGAIGYRGPQGSTFCLPHQGETPWPPDVGGSVAPAAPTRSSLRGLGCTEGPLFCAAPSLTCSEYTYCASLQAAGFFALPFPPPSDKLEHTVSTPNSRASEWGLIPPAQQPAAGRDPAVGGVGHYFMENPQGLEGGIAPKIAVCSKIGYLARAVLSTDAPHPANHPQSSACFYKAGAQLQCLVEPHTSRASFLPDSFLLHCPVVLGVLYLLSQRQKCSTAHPGDPYGQGKTGSLGVLQLLVGLSVRAWHTQVEASEVTRTGVHSGCGRWDMGMFRR